MLEISKVSLISNGDEGAEVTHANKKEDGRCVDTPGQGFSWAITPKLRALFEDLAPHIPLIIGLPTFEEMDYQEAREFCPTSREKSARFVCTGFTIAGTHKIPLFILTGGFYNEAGSFTMMNTPRKPLNAETEKAYRFTPAVRDTIAEIKNALPAYMDGDSGTKQGDLFAEEPKITSAKIAPPAVPGKDVPIFKDEANGSPEGTTSGGKIPKADPEAMKRVMEGDNQHASSPADVAAQIVREVNGGGATDLEIDRHSKRSATVTAEKKAPQTPGNPAGGGHNKKGK